MASDFHKGPNLVHPETPSAVGSRNSLNRDGRDEYVEGRVVLDEEVDKIMNHISAKLPPEVLQDLSVMGNIKSYLHSYYNSSFQNMLNRYLTTAEDELGKKVRDLIETRLMLESQTAYLAAQRAGKASLQEIEHAIQQMAKHLDQPEKYLEFDLQFHLAIARATENSILFNLVSMTRGYLQEWIKESLAESRGSRRELRAKLSVREHKKILEALRKGHAESARQAMTDHILSSGAGLQKHIK